MRAHRLVSLIVLLLAPAIASVLPVTMPDGDDTIVPAPPTAAPLVAPTTAPRGTPTANRATGETVSGTVIQQEFPAGGTRIDTITLLATSPAAVVVTVQRNRSGTWEDLSTQTVAPTDTTDGQQYILNFAPPLVVTREQPIRVTIRTDGTPDGTITAWKNGGYQPEGYQFTVNNQPQTGTLRFTARYAPRSGRLIGMLGAVWSRVTVFLGPLWRIGLVAGVCLFVVSFGVIARFLTR